MEEKKEKEKKKKFYISDPPYEAPYLFGQNEARMGMYDDEYDEEDEASDDDLENRLNG